MAHGTATIINDEASGIYVLTFKGQTSSLVGRQVFGNSSAGFRAALDFCYERGLSLVDCQA
jgi:hypothetical protein